LRPLSIAGIAALAGVIALVAFLPRTDPSASVPLTLDRTHAIERARHLASEYGLDTTQWRAAVTDEVAGKLRAYQLAYPADPAARLFSPLKLDVTLIDPLGKHNANVTLFPDGRLAAWKWSGPSPQSPSIPSPERLLADLMGPSAASFGPAKVSEEEARVTSVREWRTGPQFQMTATLTTEQKGGALTSAKLTPVYTDTFNKEYRQAQRRTLGNAADGVAALVWLVGFCLAIRQVVRGRMVWRIPLMLLAAQIIWGIFSFFGTADYQEFLGRSESGPDALITIASENLLPFWSFFWWLVFAMAGYPVRSTGNREKWYSLELISRGRILNRTVGQAVAVGALSGIGLAALPYIVAAIRGIPGNTLDFRAMDLLVAPSVVLAAVRMSACIPLLALFGFLFPFVRFLRKPWLFWPIFVPLGIMGLVSSTPFHAIIPELVTASLLLAAYVWIYRRVDLLSVLAAAVTAAVALVPGILLSQPLSSIRESAMPLLTIGAVTIAASVYWAVRGPEAEAHVPAAATTLSTDTDSPEQSDRERLQAEFQVARKAQQDALPAEPPLVNGYTLAGWCEPAQQVGGDLYDFFPLPDGRTGVAVADVSGKGVPAALYMMVTKGLMTAVSRESNQLAYILEQTNLHLYRACRKKVFVTLAAVVLDPESLRMEYGRAGHNPLVWRRARRGETSLVKPPGLGLGMTPGERFTRSLKIQELDLEPEDAIVLYSDGVTEAVNHEMEQFGEERLMRSVEATDGQPAAASRDAILRDLAAFMGTTPARDDITLVVIRA